MNIFNRKKYIAIIIVIVLLILGYFLMSGPKPDVNSFNDGIFSFRRITLSPFVILSSFGLLIYLILSSKGE